MFSDFFRRAGSDPTQKNYQRRRELSIGHIFSLLRPLAPENTLKNRKVKIQKNRVRATYRRGHRRRKSPKCALSSRLVVNVVVVVVVVVALAKKTTTGFAGNHADKLNKSS